MDRSRQSEFRNQRNRPRIDGLISQFWISQSIEKGRFILSSPRVWLEDRLLLPSRNYLALDLWRSNAGHLSRPARSSALRHD